jgi:putative nucleotidyltransferase with HDIG domain
VNFLQQRFGTRPNPNRRRTAQATQAERRRASRRRLLGATVLLALLLWAILAIRPSSIPGLRQGSPSPVSIQANRTISFRSNLQTNQARLQAESDSRNVVYEIDSQVLVTQRSQLDLLLTTITNLRDDPNLLSSGQITRLSELPNSALVISPTLATDIITLTDEQWRRTMSTALSLYDRAVQEHNYVITPQALNELRERSLSYWASLAAAPAEREIALLLTTAFLSSNQVINEAATVERRENAVRSVQPVVVTIQAGESIVRQGDLVTPAIQEKLEALGNLQPNIDWLRIAGQGLFAALIAGMFGTYLGVMHRKLWLESRQLVVIMLLFATAALVGRLTLPLSEQAFYTFPLITGVLLIAALFNGGVALLAATLIGLFVTQIADGSLALTTSVVLGSVAGSLTVHRPSRSLDFLLAGLVVALTTAATQLALALLIYGGPSIEELIMALLFGGINGSLAAVLALGLYNIVGQFAGIVTPLRLMELAHPSQPLLRRLMREAPGTYYHSINVGNLAENAAEAIGADVLLLRVAAYYHDIGKTIRPYFFTDNQSDRENVHNDLDPSTSAQIIVDHVREGIKLAQAAKLPPVIIDFIATHHGTTLIRHFYQLALQQGDDVDIEAFRYPGPKPRTREQGILMLADSVEATVRSKAQHGQILSNRDPANGTQRPSNGKQTLEDLVASIIEDRLKYEQLDESELSVQDLAIIKQTFVATLQGIYHPRVEYAPQLVKTP